ncbi:MAG: DUF4363 family protein [Ruminococcus sp.]|nr:DUF4363 family protein [Ruminococcus sp.]
MNRAVVCGVLMAVIAAVSVGSVVMLDRSTEHILGLIDAVTEAGESGTPEEVEDTIAALEDYWRGHYIRLSVIVQTGALNDISYALAKLRPLYAHNADDFIAECRGIRRWVELICEGQLPRVYSVL